MTSEPCQEYLTDRQFLEHMIPHHQVAVDMSRKLIRTTKTPYMSEMCRSIIRIQEYEIWIMEMVLSGQRPPDISVDTPPPFQYPKHEDNIANLPLSCYFPEGTRDETATCDSKFFQPHQKHRKHQKITDRQFLEHMIPHHQVAVNMSQRLLKHTKNPFMIEFCRRIIQSQEYEIWVMKGILKNCQTYQSVLL